MNENKIEELQDLALQQKGFSLLCEIYRVYITENKDSYTDDERDAINYAITSINKAYAKTLKNITDGLK